MCFSYLIYESEFKPCFNYITIIGAVYDIDDRLKPLFCTFFFIFIYFFKAVSSVGSSLCFQSATLNC